MKLLRDRRGSIEIPVIPSALSRVTNDVITMDSGWLLQSGVMCACDRWNLIGQMGTCAHDQCMPSWTLVQGDVSKVITYLHTKQYYCESLAAAEMTEVNGN